MPVMSSSAKPSPEDLQLLAANVGRLTTLLTKEREGLPAAYLKDPGLRSAYVRYYLPANREKIHLALAELSLHADRLLSKSRLRVLDLGTGPGTALLGLLTFFAQQTERPALACTAVDGVGENLRIAGELFSAYCSDKTLDATLMPLHADLEAAERAIEGTFDLILLSNVLNELFPSGEDRIAGRTGLVRSLLTRALAPDGSCVIIEPALRDTSRDLLGVRDGLAASGLTVYSPCLTSAACPAGKNPKDWCHEDIPWHPPALIKEIDRLTGLRKDSLKFSYLVLRKDGRSLADPFGPNAFRVVSEPLITKGKLEYYVCGAGGRKLITRLDKERTETNRLFEALKRGTIVGFERLADERNRYKIKPDTSVTIHRHTY